MKDALKRWPIIHRYYKITRFYSFLKTSAYQGLFMVVVFVLLLMAVNFFIIDINLMIHNIVEKYSPTIVILFPLISTIFIFHDFIPRVPEVLTQNHTKKYCIIR